MVVMKWAAIRLYVIFMLLSAVNAYGQEQQDLYQQANAYYNKSEYLFAAKLYNRIAKIQGQNVPTNVLVKLADSYRRINNYDLAVQWYEQLVKRKTDAITWSYYGDMLKCQGKYQEAKKAYQTYEKLSGIREDNKLAGCDSALVWVNNGNRIYEVKPLSPLNTGMSDWGALSFGDMGIVFISDSLRDMYIHPNDDVVLTNEGRQRHNYYKVYMEYKQKYNLVYGFSHAFNFSQFHVGPVAFNKGLDTAYVTLTDPENINYTRNGKEKVGVRVLKLYTSVKDSTGWKKITPFPYNDQNYSVGHAALSPKGDVLYFVRDSAGYGRTDIWYCERMNDGSWAAPQNCGPVINTTGDEDFAYFGADGALYFSSDGHIGLGGLDVFRTEGEKNKWETPVNMQAPINSSADDFSFVPESMTSGFLSSNRPGGKGNDDIYSVTYKYLPGITYISGFVTDSVSKTSIPGVKVHIKNADTDTVITTSADGKYTVWLDRKKSYHITFTKDGAKLDEMELTPGKQFYDLVTSCHLAPPTKIDATLNGIEELSTVRDSSLYKFINYYEYNQAQIRPQDTAILTNIVSLMKRDESLYLIVASFTDCKGSASYNAKLSSLRAKAVKTYLTNAGIPAKRINTSFFGKSHLMKDCDDKNYDATTQQENRRSELLLTRKAGETWEKARYRK